MTTIVRELRDLVPLRPLTMTESFRVAELQANRLLAISGVEEPPVPEAIISGLPKVQIERLSLDPRTSGMTEWSHGRWLILINSRHVAGRQRYSIAHEAKHLIDSPFVKILYPSAGNHSEQWELVCDYFAACLLMPRKWVKRAYCDDGIQEVRRLADRFDVSQQAMAYRLTQLGLVQPAIGRHAGVRS